jgi:signal transduction histidine kinase
MSREGEARFMSRSFSELLNGSSIRDYFGSSFLSKITKPEGVNSLVFTNDKQLSKGSILVTSIPLCTLATLATQELFFVAITPAPTMHGGLLLSPMMLLATAAHDIKNPLGSIFGYAEILLETAVGTSLTDKQRELIERMRGASVRSLDLIKNYQALSQAEHRGIPRLNSSKDLGIIVESIIQTTWRDGADKPHLIYTPSPEPIAVYVDQMYIERILGNLISNAYKYTPQHGSVKISLELCNGEAFFHITNSEPCIPESDAVRLFAPYERGASTGTISGSGLGLYIVKVLVEKLGGTIALTTTPERGNTFTVKLPEWIL